MTDADKARWDERYQQGAYQERTRPSQFLSANADRLTGGRALDLACGAGRNALYLAQRGFDVDGWDVSTVALERGAARAETLGLSVAWRQIDLDDAELPDATYDLIIQVRYVNWSLTGQVARALKPGGMFLGEQHLQTEHPVIGPTRPEFRAAPGQLEESVAGLQVESYLEGLQTDPDGRPVALAQIIARR
jgi:SAM-dependent methyltransferase